MEDLGSITERLKLLADPTRLRVLHLLKLEELTVGELAAALGQGQSTVSSHLARLRDAGFVQDRRDGTRSFYRLNVVALEAQDRSFWELCESKLGDDAMLQSDRDRLESVVLARRDGSWVDRAAGCLDRRYVPGRSFESLALGLAGMLELGDCVDMGSGDGSLLDLVAPACKSLVCIDSHPRMIAAGEERLAASRYEHVSFVLGDMQAPPINAASKDSVLFLQSLQYAEDPRAAIVAAGGLLREGGRCLVLTLGSHRDQRIQAEYGHQHAGFETQELVDCFEAAGLRIQRCERLGQDQRSPQLPILVGQAVKSGAADGEKR